MNPQMFANQTVNKNLSLARNIAELGYLSKHIDGGVTVRNKRNKQFTSESRMQKTEHEGSFNAMYRKSSLPSIGTEIETEDPLKIVSQ